MAEPRSREEEIKFRRRQMGQRTDPDVGKKLQPRKKGGGGLAAKRPEGKGEAAGLLAREFAEQFGAQFFDTNERNRFIENRFSGYQDENGEHVPGVADHLSAYEQEAWDLWAERNPEDLTFLVLAALSEQGGISVQSLYSRVLGSRKARDPEQKKLVNQAVRYWWAKGVVVRRDRVTESGNKTPYLYIKEQLPYVKHLQRQEGINLQSVHAGSPEFERGLRSWTKEGAIPILDAPQVVKAYKSRGIELPSVNVAIGDDEYSVGLSNQYQEAAGELQKIRDEVDVMRSEVQAEILPKAVKAADEYFKTILAGDPDHYDELINRYREMLQLVSSPETATSDMSKQQLRQHTELRRYESLREKGQAAAVGKTIGDPEMILVDRATMSRRFKQLSKRGARIDPKIVLNPEQVAMLQRSERRNPDRKAALDNMTWYPPFKPKMIKASEMALLLARGSDKVEEYFISHDDRSFNELKGRLQTELQQLIQAETSETQERAKELKKLLETITSDWMVYNLDIHTWRVREKHQPGPEHRRFKGLVPKERAPAHALRGILTPYEFIQRPELAQEGYVIDPTASMKRDQHKAVQTWLNADDLEDKDPEFVSKIKEARKTSFETAKSPYTIEEIKSKAHAGKDDFTSQLISKYTAEAKQWRDDAIKSAEGADLSKLFGLESVSTNLDDRVQALEARLQELEEQGDDDAQMERVRQELTQARQEAAEPGVQEETRENVEAEIEQATEEARDRRKEYLDLNTELKAWRRMVSQGKTRPEDAEKHIGQLERDVAEVEMMAKASMAKLKDLRREATRHKVQVSDDKVSDKEVAHVVKHYEEILNVGDDEQRESQLDQFFEAYNQAPRDYQRQLIGALRQRIDIDQFEDESKIREDGIDAMNKILIARDEKNFPLLLRAIVGMQSQLLISAAYEDLIHIKNDLYAAKKWNDLSNEEMSDIFGRWASKGGWHDFMQYILPKGEFSKQASEKRLQWLAKRISQKADNSIRGVNRVLVLRGQLADLVKQGEKSDVVSTINRISQHRFADSEFGIHPAQPLRALMFLVTNPMLKHQGLGVYKPRYALQRTYDDRRPKEKVFRTDLTVDTDKALEMSESTSTLAIINATVILENIVDEPMLNGLTGKISRFDLKNRPIIVELVENNKFIDRYVRVNRSEVRPVETNDITIATIVSSLKDVE